MRKSITVRPADGLQIRKEDGTPMPEEGCVVPDTRYYRRRITDGDLLLQEDAKAETKKQESKA